jgi:hypothetical protein
VVHLEDVLDTNRVHEVEFARARLNDHYGWLTIISIALCLFTGSKIGFGVDGQEIWLPVVLNAQGKSSLQTLGTFMPADLAKYFNVQPTDPNATVGTIPDANSEVQARSR